MVNWKHQRWPKLLQVDNKGLKSTRAVSSRFGRRVLALNRLRAKGLTTLQTGAIFENNFSHPPRYGGLTFRRRRKHTSKLVSALKNRKRKE